MDRNLCLNKEDKRLYKILYKAINMTKDMVGIATVVYHYIENNAVIFVQEERQFNEEFIRLRR